jgi:COP9 signalosome complex subunit 3
MDTKLFSTMDDLIPKLLTFPPVPALAEPISDFTYDQSIRAISQLLISAPPGKLASGLSTGEDVFDVSYKMGMTLVI